MGQSNTSVDIETFEGEALPHLDACMGLALRLTRNAEEAEDLVQEALLRALRFFHRFEPGTNFKAWVFKILLNTFINSYRKGAVRVEDPASHNLELLYERMGGRQGSHRTSDPERNAINYEIVTALQEALNTLPETFRAVVHLADIEGCTYKEIASIVECPIGTVMSRLHRGRRLLQAALVHHRPPASSRSTQQEEGPLGRSTLRTASPRKP
ncbi:MAG: sigma-70 family RNA polymerase sigma factor [Nitrospinota bacterium]